WITGHSGKFQVRNCTRNGNGRRTGDRARTLPFPSRPREPIRPRFRLYVRVSPPTSNLETDMTSPLNTASSVPRSMSADSAVQTLAPRLEGTVLTPSSPGYDDARQIWNAMIDRRPALIARCASVADIQHAIRFAGDHGLPIAVRGGGHNIAGSALCDGGLV